MGVLVVFATYVELNATLQNVLIFMVDMSICPQRVLDDFGYCEQHYLPTYLSKISGFKLQPKAVTIRLFSRSSVLSDRYFWNKYSQLFRVPFLIPPQYTEACMSGSTVPWTDKASFIFCWQSVSPYKHNQLMTFILLNISSIVSFAISCVPSVWYAVWSRFSI